jgi:pimeloyl-ACP methyl ester carboxylesterase
VLPLLDKAGVDATALDLPGHGGSTAPFGDLHGDADSVRRFLDAGEGPVVLVGHSYGGAVVTDAGAHPRVKHVVYLCAFQLDEDESCSAAATDAAVPSTDLSDVISISEDGAWMVLNEECAPDIFYGDCAPDAVNTATAQLTKQPLATFMQTPRAIAWRDRPSTYVVCTDDRAVHPDLQRALAKRATNVVEWDTSHSPFVSRPDLVADLLVAIAKETDG